MSDPAGELVALTLYRKGAAEVARRLDAALTLAGVSEGCAVMPLATDADTPADAARGSA